MRISGIEPSSVILVNLSIVKKKLKSYVQIMSQKVEAKTDGVINL